MKQWPEWMPRETCREWMSAGKIGKIFKVGNLRADTFIKREADTGRPIKSVRHGRGGGGFAGKRYRPIDVYSRAVGKGLEILPADKELAGWFNVRQEIPKLIEERDRLSEEIASLRQYLEAEKPLAKLDSVALGLTGSRLYREDEIVRHSEELHTQSGVYFLCKGSSVVYVGQSVNVAARIASHAGTKDFDTCTYLPCHRGQLDVVESLYIHVFRPPLNGNPHSRNQLCAPIGLAELVGCGGLP